MEEGIPTDPELWQQAERLRALARTLIADPGAREELVQETWLAALRRPLAARESPGAWLAGTLRHLALGRRRREAQRPQVERRAARAEALEGPEEAVARAELQQRLWQAVLALDEPNRSAVILRHLDQLDPGEIARRQGCTRAAARQRIARGLEELRRRLDLEHGGRERWCLVLAPLARGAGAEAPLPLVTTIGGLAMGSKLLLTAAGLLATTALILTARGTGRQDPRGPESPPSKLGLAELPLPVDGRTVEENGDERVALAPEPTRPTLPLVSDTANELLRGRVIDRAGAPVPGARVYLRRSELAGFLVLDLEVARRVSEVWDEQFSDADGRFSFAPPHGLALDVWAEKEGFCEATALDRHAGQTLELVLGPGYRLHGRVTREQDGEPVPLATVRANQLGRHTFNHERETRTDLEGRYELRFPVGDEVRLDVLPLAHQARNHLRVDFGPLEEAELDVAVLEGLLVEGRITAADTGRPIAGAVIGEGWTYQRTATSDANGEYRLYGFGADGTYELYARAPGFGQAVDSPEIVDARRRRLDFALQPARTAFGRLVDATGEAVEGAYLAAVARGRSSAIDWSPARSDADGRFRCADLVPELRHALLVHHPGFATVVYDFPPSERTLREIDLGRIVLQPPGLIAGRVRDSSGRAAGGTVLSLKGTNRDRKRYGPEPVAPRPEEIAEPYVSEREVVADEDGRFWFGEVAAGDYVLAGTAAGRAPLEELALTLAEGEERDDLELVFLVGSALRGRVIDEDGLGLARVQVCATQEDGPREQRFRILLRTGSDGSFELRDLVAGNYRLEVFPWTMPPSAAGTETPVRWLYAALEHVPTDSDAVVLRLQRGAPLEGVLRNAAGEPLHGHQITIRDSEGEYGLGGSTDSDGRFSLAVEPDKLWTLEVSGPDGELGFHTLLTRTDIPSGSRDLELRLPR